MFGSRDREEFCSGERNRSAPIVFGGNSKPKFQIDFSAQISKSTERAGPMDYLNPGVWFVGFICNLGFKFFRAPAFHWSKDVPTPSGASPR